MAKVWNFILLENGVIVCPRCPGWQTTEERISTLHAWWHRDHLMASGFCPDCEQPFTAKVQVGRCVYADPCGHRLYQGKA